MISVTASDKRVQNDGEFSDSEDEGEGGRRNKESFKQRKRMKIDESANNSDAKKPEGAKPEEKGTVKYLHFTRIYVLCLNMLSASENIAIHIRSAKRNDVVDLDCSHIAMFSDADKC